MARVAQLGTVRSTPAPNDRAQQMASPTSPHGEVSVPGGWRPVLGTVRLCGASRAARLSSPMAGQGRCGVTACPRCRWLCSAPSGRGTSVELSQGRWGTGSPQGLGCVGQIHAQGRATHRHGTCPWRPGMAWSHQLCRLHREVAPHPSLSHHGHCAGAGVTAPPSAPKSLLCQPEPSPQG